MQIGADILTEAAKYIAVYFVISCNFDDICLKNSMNYFVIKNVGLSNCKKLHIIYTSPFKKLRAHLEIVCKNVQNAGRSPLNNVGDRGSGL